MTVKENIAALNEMTNNGFEHMTTLGELNMKVAEQMATRQMDLMSRYMEQGTRFMQAATQARGYGELYKAQVDIAKQATEQMMAESKTSLQLATEARDEYRAWYESTVSDLRQHSGLGAA